ncbi:hypothetical protein AVEN_189529-1 [Araneus ventricosus]|uniref:Uncharacterized protein n=1 Tax=Araneus ventricosus TaxID=182803 RepID=A0A4Y2GNZ4_ARAVE|nr:hypothetical protein AVEN_189529-1 [Araneus ventricosus]
MEEVRLTSRFEATRGLFRDGPRNFEPRSDDEDDTLAGNPFSKFPLHTDRRRLATAYDSVQQAPYSADLQWNRVSKLRVRGRDLTTRPRETRN